MAVSYDSDVPSGSADRQKHKHKDPACVACGKSKRRCSKQRPSCLRCRTKGLRCGYPVTRIMLAAEHQNDYEHGQTSSNNVTSNANGNGHTSSGHNSSSSSHATPSSGAVHTPEQHHTDAPSPTSHRPQNQTRPRAGHLEPLQDPWFLSPSSWEIDGKPGTIDIITYPDSGLDGFLSRLGTWLDQWTSQNHCIIIHRRLYMTDLPECLQLAYAAYRTYRSSTPANKLIALRVASTCSNCLIQQQSIYDGLEITALDTRTHLARTQALFILQYIRLFDGDVRARAEAETTSLTLHLWAKLLMQRASMDTVPSHHSGNDDHSPPTPTANNTTELSGDGTLTSQWRAWILGESIRRTWVASTLTEAAYSIKKHGSTNCPGSIAFTATSGLWDAQSPSAWLARLRDAGEARFPVHCEGLVGLLSEASASEVDEFTHALLIYGTGREVCEDWMVS